MERCPDMYDMWEAYDTKLEVERGRRMVCSECSEHIVEDACYYINGEYICERCMDKYVVATPVED